MVGYLASRFSFMLMSLLGVLVLSFSLIHFIPGDPVEIMLGEQASAEDKANLKKALGLDQPLTQQFVHYLKGLSRGDLGRSLTLKTPVATQIKRHFRATLELTLCAMGLALLWGLPLGVWSASSKQKWVEWSVTGISLLAMSLPGVFLGPILIYIFALELNWFPVSDRGTWMHLILPSVSLAFPLGSVILRMSRTAMLEVVNEDYIRTAKSKGLSDGPIYFKHALKNAMIPIITIVGLQLGALLTGTVVTETVFDWPGLGSLLFSAIQRRDFPLVQGCVLIVASVYTLTHFATDLTYGFLNPKMKAGG